METIGAIWIGLITGHNEERASASEYAYLVCWRSSTFFDSLMKVQRSFFFICKSRLTQWWAKWVVCDVWRILKMSQINTLESFVNSERVWDNRKRKETEDWAEGSGYCESRPCKLRARSPLRYPMWTENLCKSSSDNRMQVFDWEKLISGGLFNRFDWKNDDYSATEVPDLCLTRL